jgi:hypothetical protein
VYAHATTATERCMRMQQLQQRGIVALAAVYEHAAAATERRMRMQQLQQRGIVALAAVYVAEAARGLAQTLR